MEKSARELSPVIGTHRQSDGYGSRFRRWGADGGEDAIVLLHGGISHAGWQAPLGEAIVRSSDIAFVTLDRRGSGLNEVARGHLISEEREVEDVLSLVETIARSYRRVHLAGWCFGGQVASIIASRAAGRGLVTSLVMVAPGFVFGERYADVLRLSMQSVFGALEALGIQPDPARPFVPVPLQPSDFTESRAWLDFIERDELRLRHVTPSTVSVWNDLANRSRTVLGQLGGIPVLAVLAGRDRLVDNARVRAMLLEQVRPAPQIEELDAHHAVQFDAPEALAAIVSRFVRGVGGRA